MRRFPRLVIWAGLTSDIVREAGVLMSILGFGPKEGDFLFFSMKFNSVFNFLSD